MRPELVVKIRDTAAMANKECGSGRCQVGKWGCCDAAFCWAVHRGLSKLGITYEFDPDAELPYMGPEGCRVLPEHRPGCAIHVCHDRQHGCLEFAIRDTWDEAKEDPAIMSLNREFIGVVVSKQVVVKDGRRIGHRLLPLFEESLNYQKFLDGMTDAYIEEHGE